MFVFSIRTSLLVAPMVYGFVCELFICIHTADISLETISIDETDLRIYL